MTNQEKKREDEMQVAKERSHQFYLTPLPIHYSKLGLNWVSYFKLVSPNWAATHSYFKFFLNYRHTKYSNTKCPNISVNGWLLELKMPQFSELMGPS